MGDLQDAIDARWFGTGKAVRDKLFAKSERRLHVPKPQDMNELVLAFSPEAMVGSFGFDPTIEKDIYINAEGYAATATMDGAKIEAMAIIALWNAYREGDLIWKSDKKASK